jgi:hypothetical protein
VSGAVVSAALSRIVSGSVSGAVSVDGVEGADVGAAVVAGAASSSLEQPAAAADRTSASINLPA